MLGQQGIVQVRIRTSSLKKY